MTDNQQLLHALTYQGGGTYRDSRTPVGQTAITLHGIQLLDLAKECELDAVSEATKELREALESAEKDLVFYKDSMKRVAEVCGVTTPLILMAMAENNSETYVDLLIKFVEKYGVKPKAIAAAEKLSEK